MKPILILTVLFFTIGCSNSKKSTSSDTTNNETAEKKPDRGQEKQPSTEELFAKMDTNEDGRLSKSEVKGPLADHFDEIDTNDDGYISREEMENAPKPERPPRGQRPPRN